MNNPLLSSKLYFYILKKCHCNYIESERAYSAFITLAGYDYQVYELDKFSARHKLASKLFNNRRVLDWFKERCSH